MATICDGSDDTTTSLDCSIIPNIAIYKELVFSLTQENGRFVKCAPVLLFTITLPSI